MGRLYSKLDSTEATYSLARYGGIGNPVGNILKPTREMAPMSQNVPATVMHPKLNTTGWNISYRVVRSEQPKSRRRRRGARKG